MTVTTARAYYNEIDEAAAYVLREQIARGVIAPGDVDTRSIKEVQPDDLRGYTQHHFFAGGGLWSIAARWAGMPDDRPFWSASCPCQGESLAGKRLGADDPRHLWPDLYRLARACRPSLIVGEQVAAAAGTHWLDRVCADLEDEDYAIRAVDLPACAVDGPHQRQRLFWLAVDDRERARLERQRGNVDRCEGRPREARPVAATDGLLFADANSCGRDGRQKGAERGSEQRAAAERASSELFGDAESQRREARGRYGEARHWGAELGPSYANGSWWADAEWIVSPIDGKARRAKPGFCNVAHGISGGLAESGAPRADDVEAVINGGFLVTGMKGRVDAWRIAGNAIVPQLAAEVLAAYLDTENA